MEDPDLERRVRSHLDGLDRRVHPGDDDLVPAAVLFPLLRARDGHRILLTRRSQHVGAHKGQISFPGGKVEPDDTDAVATALREAEEEVGIRPEHVEPLGLLHDRVTTSNFLVTPVVAALDHPYPYRLDTREIDEVIELPVRAFLDPAVHRVQSAGLLRGEPYFVHYYQVGPHLVWGATAWFVHELLSAVFAS